MSLTRCLPAALGAALCLLSLNGPVQARTVRVTDSDNNGQVRLAPGDTLAVRLRANVTTGYSWQVGQNNPAVLRPLGRPRYQNPPNGLPGAGGLQTLRFRAQSAGGVSLVLLYRRPFEHGVRAARTYRLLVTVSRPGRHHPRRHVHRLARA